MLLPLLILLRLHGSLLDVALAAVLYNSSVILASIVWGHLSDRSPNRRLFLAVNFTGFAVLYAVLGAVPSLPLLFVLYTVIGCLAPAGTSASNLLILEQFPEVERSSAFASFQEMSILGAIGGLFIGYFWLLAGGALAPLLYAFGALAAVSVAAVVWGIEPSPVALTTGHVAHHSASLVSRLRHFDAFRSFVPFFPLRPSIARSGLRRFRAWVVVELHHELPLIIAAGFLFNFAANLFNTSYTPYLESVGVASAGIFLINSSNNLAQGALFPVSGALANREGSDRLVRQATYVRSLGYLAVAGFTFVPMFAAGAFGANAITFGILGGAIALYSTASSLILFRGLRGRDAGTILGVNSAFGGVAAVVGALLSGVLSFYGSYRLTFLVAAGALLVSLPLWSAAQVAYANRRRQADTLQAPAPAPGPSELPGPPRPRPAASTLAASGLEPARPPEEPIPTPG